MEMEKKYVKFSVILELTKTAKKNEVKNIQKIPVNVRSVIVRKISLAWAGTQLRHAWCNHDLIRTFCNVRQIDYSFLGIVVKLSIN